MARFAFLLIMASFIFCGCPVDSDNDKSSRENEVPNTMAYVDMAQVPVPPEAISPYEPSEITYVDDPSIEFDSDVNLDVKLLSKYRYTNTFVERYKAEYDYTPTCPIMTDKDFFSTVDLNHQGLEKVKAAVDSRDFTKARDEYLIYQSERPRPNQLKLCPITKEAGEAAVIDADEIIKDPDFPACVPGKRYSLFGLMRVLERAAIHTNDRKYADAWLEMFSHWYETYRPPAQRPKAYIGFVWLPYWRTLGAGGTAIHMCDTERWLAKTGELNLDKERNINFYKSILEHAQFLEKCNDVFMPGNWQTCQCEALIKIGAYFPEFNDSENWIEPSWELFKEHMITDTYDDGTHIENSVNYATGVIDQYRRTVNIIRKTGREIPEDCYRKWESMYLSMVKIMPPAGNGVPVGDGGIGPDGYLIKGTIIEGALEFANPILKEFSEWYPDDVERIANDQCENTAQALDAYNKTKAQIPPYKSIHLPDSDWVVMRNSWDKNSSYMFLDFGWDEAWHSHPDFGNFNIHAFGKPICTECGRTGPYEADINKRWYKQTIAHNTVWVDSRSQRKCTNNRVEQWWTGERFDFTDAWSDGYRWIGVLHNRRAIFVKPGYWIITDFLPGPAYYQASFQTSGYHTFDWLAHFQPTELKIDKKTKRIDTSNDDANLALIPLNADEVEIHEKTGPMVTPADGVKDDAPYISLHQARMPFVQYQVLLYPYEGKDAPDIEIKTLETDWIDRAHRRNYGYEIELPDRTDVFLETGNSNKMATFGKYKFQGDLAHVVRANNPDFDVLLINASHLEYNGMLIFSSLETIEAIEISHNNLLLEIGTESDISGARILAPGVTVVIFSNREFGYSFENGYVVID